MSKRTVTTALAVLFGVHGFEDVVEGNGVEVFIRVHDYEGGL